MTLLPGLVATAEILEDLEQNYRLEIPDGWARQPTDPRWAAHGIVLGARRELDRSGEGDAATGKGAFLELAVTDAPKGRGLDALAADAGVRTFLLGRFGEPESRPPVEVHPRTYEDGLEVRVLSADGQARNLLGSMARARGVMIVAVAKGRLFRLRMYAFPTAFDEEGLKHDLDEIEGGFEIPDLTPEAPKEVPPPPTDDPPDVVDGDEGEEVRFGDPLVGWELVKPVGVKSKPDFDRTTHENTVAFFEDRDPRGSYQVLVAVLRNDRRVGGVQVASVDLRAWGLDSWWAEFDRDHPAGEVRTWPWARRAKALLSLPDFARERTLFEDGSSRPPDPERVKGRDLLKPHRAVERVKNQDLGEERTIGAYRGVLGARRERFGAEVQIRYLWKTPRLTCFVSVSIMGEGLTKWGEGIAALLRSIEMTGRP